MGNAFLQDETRAGVCSLTAQTFDLSLSLPGYQNVPASAKAPRVRAVFDAVAPAYDLMNDAMSVGLHRLWKDATVAALGPALAAAGAKHLDLAGGTGDIARRVAERLAAADAEAAGRAATAATLSGKAPPPHTETSSVVVCDVNEAMMDEGRKASQAGQRGWSPATASLVDWVVGDAEALPFPTATFDSATIAFGLRNVTRPTLALKEIVRVLKPGGAFACLEFSQVPAPPLAALYDAWSFNAIPQLGKAIHGDAAPYQYLVESIRRFPSKRALAALMEDAGFHGVRVRSFAAGAVALHQGWKV